jgi:hypothetical protein
MKARRYWATAWCSRLPGASLSLASTSTTHATTGTRRASAVAPACTAGAWNRRTSKPSRRPRTTAGPGGTPRVHPGREPRANRAVHARRGVIPGCPRTSSGPGGRSYAGLVRATGSRPMTFAREGRESWHSVRSIRSGPNSVWKDAVNAGQTRTPMRRPACATPAGTGSTRVIESASASDGSLRTP